jgi:hypothetical protein
MTRKLSIAAGNYTRKVSLYGMTRKLSIAAGNYTRKVSLYGMTRKLFIAAGNYLQKVSYTAWDRSVSKRQETICEKFLTRHDTKAVHSDRKLYAKSFLYGMTRKLFIAAGNCLRRDSYSAWDRSVS